MIDLASSYDSPCGVNCSDEPDKKFYPNFHYDGNTDLDLPKEGTMTIKFKVTSREERERDGKTRYGYSVDVCSIESVDGSDEDEAPSKSYDDASSALDKIAEALQKKAK